MYIYIYTHICKYTYIDICMYTCGYTIRTYTYIHACLHSYMTDIHTCTQTCLVFLGCTHREYGYQLIYLQARCDEYSVTYESQRRAEIVFHNALAQLHLTEHQHEMVEASAQETMMAGTEAARALNFSASCSQAERPRAASTPVAHPAPAVLLLRLQMWWVVGQCHQPCRQPAS